MIRKALLLLTLPLALLAGCGVYSFTGGSISAGMKTVSVLVFENTSALVNPNLSQSFTEALKARIRSQTSLSFVRVDGDANFSGRITDYNLQPVAIQADQKVTAGLTRLSITVNVKYTNKLEADKSFEQSFTRYKDFSTQGSPFSSQETALVKDINDQLTEDIYNRAFANW